MFVFLVTLCMANSVDSCMTGVSKLAYTTEERCVAAMKEELSTFDPKIAVVIATCLQVEREGDPA